MSSAPSDTSIGTLLRRAPLLLATFLVVLIGVTLVLRARIPMPAHYDLDDKLKYFLEHKDEFDLIFVGSSATFRNYVPAVVDAGLAEEGLEVKSFNFGIVGFRSFETDFFLKWILAQEPARLKWMVIEPPTFDPPFDYGAIQAAKSELEVHSHTPEETVLIVRSVWLADLTLEQKLLETWRHFKVGMMNALNIGRAPSVVAQLAAADDGWEPPAWLVEGAGFQAVEDRPNFVEPDPNPLGTRADYRAKAESVERKNRAEVDLARYNRLALERQVAVVRAHGVEPIYCISPMLFVMPEVLSLGRKGLLPNLMAFHLPLSFPALFVYEERIDATHYRRVGAERFSAFLAPRLAEILKATGP